ncbi:hypothetical protein A7U60_g2150 [Sanghuangporus baumii]|uniref:Fungal-type protein kinase domain-containing protein n=1 Tax=Sanghuangporus baumii TaxID=108892 RepID=A0A9Q5N8G9_SANBA|nr:hypothetical protein A7U60_g2150 [Sanghuangporus baumii]
MSSNLFTPYTKPMFMMNGIRSPDSSAMLEARAIHSVSVPADSPSNVPIETHEYFQATLEEMHCNLRGDVSCNIPQLKLDSFVNNLIPPLKNGIDVDGIIDSLEREGSVIAGGWNAFAIAPARRRESEGIVFAPLAEIFKSIIDLASLQTGLQPTFVLSLPRRPPQKAHGGRSHPDSYLILREAEERAQRAEDKRDKARWWYDIAFTMEFKKKASLKDRNENVSKLMFNIQQTMALDPSRRFSFGITIENTSMRLWFCSRATPVVSEELKFTTDARLVTHIFLSLAFASKEELGWDPTIRHVLRDDGEHVYHIDVCGQTYEIEQLLSDFSSDALVSHATRVWTVRHLGSGASCVLKDVWIDESQQLEHDVRETILHDVEEKFGHEARQEMAMHLLNPVAHWLVTVNGKDDHTTTVMMRGFTPSMKQRFKIRVKKASPGNLYLYDGRGILGDFEYAKRRGADVANELITGTRGFIASEAAVRTYKHLSDKQDKELVALLFAELEGSARKLVPELKCDLGPPFFHNDLHDLESLWWIAIWELFVYRGYSELCRSLNVEEDNTRKSAVRALFQNSELSGDRTLFLQNIWVYEERTSWMPVMFGDIHRFLNALRALLLAKYKKFEEEFPEVKPDMIEGTHDSLSWLFEACRTSADKIEATLGTSEPPLMGQDDCLRSDTTLPSLEQNSDNETSESSSSDIDVEFHYLATSIEVTGPSPRKRESDIDECFGPLPSLCVSR